MSDERGPLCSVNIDNGCFFLSFFSFLLLLLLLLLLLGVYSLRCSSEAKMHELATSAREQQGGFVKTAP
jgi:hypothetical protein